MVLNETTFASSRALVQCSSLHLPALPKNKSRSGARRHCLVMALLILAQLQTNARRSDHLHDGDHCVRTQSLPGQTQSQGVELWAL